MAATQDQPADTPAAFVEACAKIGLDAEARTMMLEAIPRQPLPAVVFLKNGDAAIAADAKPEALRLYWPDEDRFEWFARHGMPDADRLRALRGSIALDPQTGTPLFPLPRLPQLDISLLLDRQGGQDVAGAQHLGRQGGSGRAGKREPDAQ